MRESTTDQTNNGADASAPAARPADRPTPAPRRSENQSVRLADECRDVQRNFAYHPHIRVTPLHGNPATEYQITYRLRSVGLDDSGAVQWLDRVEMHVWLPPEFPDAQPLFRPLTPVFHPNVSPEGVLGLPQWEPRMTLTHLVTQVGFLLAYINFSEEEVADEAALQWAIENREIFPTDPSADCFPEADGGALARISKKGNKTLARMRDAFDATCHSLLQEIPPGDVEINRFCQATLQLTPLFLESELPEELLAAASELDEGARHLPAALGQFALIRGQYVAVTALQREAEEAVQLARKLSDRCAECEGVFTLDTSDKSEPAAAIRQIPPLDKMRPWQEKLNRLIEQAQRWSQSFRTRQQNLSRLPKIETGFGALLDVRLAAAVAQIEMGAALAQVSATDAMSVLGPALQQAQNLVAALGRCIDWRNYAEMLERGMGLHRRLVGRDIATVQAVYIDTASGSFGPFEMEQRIALGSTAVAVRGEIRREIEVLNADKGGTLGKSTSGKVSIEIKDEQTGEVYPYSFRITHRCDDLKTQFEFVEKKTAELLERLGQSVEPGESSFGQLARLLDKPQALTTFQTWQRDAAIHWRAIVDELDAIEPAKERLATHFLVQRYGEVIPNFVSRLAAARGALREGMSRVSYITAHSPRDKSKGLVVAPQFRAEYDELHKRMALLGAEADRLQKRINTAVETIRFRVDQPRLWGASMVPSLAVFAPVSQELAQTIASASDQHVVDAVVALEGLLNVSLLPETWARPATADQTSEATETTNEPSDTVESENNESDDTESADHSAGFATPDGMFSDEESGPQDEIIADWPGAEE